MASFEPIVIAFDLYGTLLSTDSIAERLAEQLGRERATEVATLWRRHQLEYTWRCNSMEEPIGFSQLTRSALKHALAETKLSLSTRAIDNMMQAYDSLTPYPDVRDLLSRLHDKKDDFRAVIFSNGSEEMVNACIKKSSHFQPYSDLFNSIVTLGGDTPYKPAKKCYEHLASEADAPLHEIWLVSANAFDIVGAKMVGMRTCWVDRAGTGWLDRMLEEQDEEEPDVIVRSLDNVLSEIMEEVTENPRGPIE